MMSVNEIIFPVPFNTMVTVFEYSLVLRNGLVQTYLYGVH